jgi:hypothetical protein
MLELEKPYKIANLSGGALLVGEGDLSDLKSLSTKAQIYRNGEYSPVQPLQVMLKFLYDVEVITPPLPWSEPDAG